MVVRPGDAEIINARGFTSNLYPHTAIKSARVDDIWKLGIVCSINLKSQTTIVTLVGDNILESSVIPAILWYKFLQ